jgi:hypothetical protein
MEVIKCQWVDFQPKKRPCEMCLERKSELTDELFIFENYQFNSVCHHCGYLISCYYLMIYRMFGDDAITDETGKLREDIHRDDSGYIKISKQVRDNIIWEKTHIPFSLYMR